jgi:hypothetical protein
MTMFLKHLLAPLERKTKDNFSGIVCSFAHHPAVCKWMYMAHTSHHCGVGGFWLFVDIRIENEQSNFMNWGTEGNLLLYWNCSCQPLYCTVLCSSNTVCNIWPKNVAWTWKHGPQLLIYTKGFITQRTQHTKEGQQKNHRNAADIHL